MFRVCLQEKYDQNRITDLYFYSYKPPAQGTPGAPGEDPTTDYMNVLGMIFSMCGLMMRVRHSSAFFGFKDCIINI